MRAVCQCGEKIVIRHGGVRLSNGLALHYGTCPSCGSRKKVFVEVVDMDADPVVVHQHVGTADGVSSATE